MKKIIVIVVLFLGTVFAQTKVGSSAAPFLNIAVGPRAIGLGGAFVATANDVTSLYWNPAGASRSYTNEALFAHSVWFADINYNWAGVMLNLDDLGTIGLSMTYLDYGDIEVTTLREPEGTGEKFNPSDLVLGLTYAYNLTDRFSVGGTVKYISQRIWNTNASTIAFDIGTLFMSDIYGLRIGATITNFGSDLQLDGKDLFVQYDINTNVYGNNDQIMAKLKTDPFPLPLTFRVGIAMDVLSLDMHRFTIGVDALHPTDNAESINLGAEYVFNENIALRGGYKNLLLNNTEEGLTLGFGLKYDLTSNLGVSIDYAYQDFGKLDYTQHFSMGVRF
ncbi:MAG: PorV/PorQ family protein [Ignavibacteria bacterium]|jgi:opacity protein-like surface antigen|nr:PorV/PorQ family protein [Ignavibacteria bacterium]MDP3831608.1 PorV/PorQ family protein [Ignavibacteriaceae bacterium]